MKKGETNIKNLVGMVGLIGLVLYITNLLTWGALSPDALKKYADIGTATGGMVAGSFGLACSVISVYLLYFAYKSQNELVEIAKKQAEDQKQINDHQRFEVTFFNLLSMLQKVLKDYETGLSEFRESILNGSKVYNIYPDMPMNSPKVIESYFQERNIAIKKMPLDNAVNLVCFILEHVEQEKTLNIEMKEKYYNLVSINLIDAAKYVLFFECYSLGGNNGLTAIIRRSKILNQFLNYNKSHSIPAGMTAWFLSDAA